MARRIKRSKVQIMVEILNFCKQPQTKTQVIHSADLSWEMLSKYLSFLGSQSLLKIQLSPKKYATTQKGLKFVKKWKELVGLL